MDFNVDLSTEAIITMGKGMPKPEEFNWDNICLTNCKVKNWKKFVRRMNEEVSNSLDTTLMLSPEDPEELFYFWTWFCSEMVNAKTLYSIKIYKAPKFVIESIIKSLPQLMVLICSMIRDIFDKDEKPIELNLGNLNRLKNLCMFVIRSEAPVQITSSPDYGAFKYCNTLKVNTKTHEMILSNERCYHCKIKSLTDKSSKQAPITSL